MFRVMCVTLALVLSGCGSPSLHSAASAGSPSRDAGLAGIWLAHEPATVRADLSPKADASEYAASLTVHHKGEFKSSLEVDLVLFEIDGVQFADLFLSRPARDKLVESHGFLAVPVHQVTKLSRQGDVLTVWPFEADWLRSQVGAPVEPVAVGGGELTLITASPDQMRTILQRSATAPAAFGQPMIFQRQP